MQLKKQQLEPDMEQQPVSESGKENVKAVFCRSACCYCLTCIQTSQETGKLVWYSHFCKNFPHFVVIHTVKDFSVVCEAEVNVFSKLLCFLRDPVNVGSLISGSSAFSKTSLNIWEFSVQLLLKPSLETFEHYFASM